MGDLIGDCKYQSTTCTDFNLIYNIFLRIKKKGKVVWLIAEFATDWITDTLIKMQMKLQWDYKYKCTLSLIFPSQTQGGCGRENHETLYRNCYK